jgi:Protein of unknown function (DUF2950)
LIAAARLFQRTLEDVMTPSLATLKPLAATFALIAAVAIAPGAALAQEAFKTPEAAVEALIGAAKSNDAREALAVLGNGSEDIISSGDQVADHLGRDAFVAAYEAKHQIAMDGDAKATLVIGEKDYPFAIPLVKAKSGTWSFDVADGRSELLFRRIGRNELSAIETVLAVSDAEDEYASQDHGEGVGVYAQRFFSSEGKKDGLYWQTKEGEEPSPLGPLAAVASSEGYVHADTPSPYHGYYFKILTRQGTAATGGAADYVVKDRMIGGYAIVAYPAQYRNSGVMTFIANYSGAVYQKDLGYNTPWVAGGMTVFNPDSSWTKVDTNEADNWVSAQ